MIAKKEIVIETFFQLYVRARYERPGKKINCPVAEAAVRSPVTNPRLATNHRFATVAAKTRAIEPVPVPTITPHVAINCHGDLIKIVNSAPIETVVKADMTTRRIPNFSISAAANGEISPDRRTLIAMASDMSERDQPNAFSKGTIKTEGAERNPAVTIKVTNVTATATQPG